MTATDYREQQPRRRDLGRHDPLPEDDDDERTHEAHAQHEQAGIRDVHGLALGRTRNQVIEVRTQCETGTRSDEHGGRHELPVATVLGNLEQTHQQQGTQQRQSLVEQARAGEYGTSRDE
jgi:hypothetical protein